MGKKEQGNTVGDLKELAARMIEAADFDKYGHGEILMALELAKQLLVFKYIEQELKGGG